MKLISVSNYDKKVMVDDDDYEALSVKKWHRHNCYARCLVWVPSSKRQFALLMHRVIMKCFLGDGKQVDHINRNKLDNRKSNLRLVNWSMQNQNRLFSQKKTSKYIGIYWHKEKNKWHARIKKNKIEKFLGYFKNEIDAAYAYNKKALELYGEHALINNLWG